MDSESKEMSVPASQEPPTLSEVELAKAAMGKRLVTCSAVDRPHAASICMSSEGHSFPKLAVPVVELRPSEPRCPHKTLIKQLVGNQHWYRCEACSQKFLETLWDGKVEVETP